VTRLFAGLALLSLVTKAGYSWSPQPETRGLPTRPRPTDASALHAAGDRSYVQRCAACHGRRGDGRGWAARGLTPAPRDFTAGVYKLRSTPSGSIPTDADLFATLSRGMHGTAMIPWRGLPEEERWALVERVKAFSVRFSEEEPAAAVVIPDAPANEEELASQGQQLYARLRCVACHGDGDGRGPGAALLAHDPGRKVRVRDLRSGMFLRGTSMRDIYLTLRSGMDGTPMGSYADALSSLQTWAVAAYVRTLVLPGARAP